MAGRGARQTNPGGPGAFPSTGEAAARRKRLSGAPPLASVHLLLHTSPFPMRIHGVLLCLAASAGAVFADEPAAPSPEAPVTMPALPEGKVSLDRMLEKLPGEWRGEQRMQNPKKQIMTMRVCQSYRWETRDGARVLVGETSYTIGAGEKEKTFRGVSHTRVDADGKGHAEVVEAGKTLRYDALVSEDSLVFIPEGKGRSADSGTGVCVVREGGDEFLVVRGFQSGPGGVYLVEGKLKKTKAAAAK